MRLSELYYEITQQVMRAKPGEDPIVYIRHMMSDDWTHCDFEKFYVDKEGDLIMEIY